MENSAVIEEEFGKFLLIVSAFDKFILGEFLDKEKPPNDKKMKYLILLSIQLI